MTLTGSGGPQEDHQYPLRNGKVDGDKLTFEIPAGEGKVMQFSLTVSGGSIDGEVHSEEYRIREALHQAGEVRRTSASFRTVAQSLQRLLMPERAFCCLTRESSTEGEQAGRKANGERRMVQGFCRFPCFAIRPGM